MVTSFAETTWYYLLLCRAAYMSTCKVGTCMYFLQYIYRSDWRGTWPRHVTSMDYAYSRSLSDQQQASRLHCTSYTHVPVTYIHSSARFGTLSVCLSPPVSKEAARTSSLDNLENVFDHGTETWVTARRHEAAKLFEQSLHHKYGAEIRGEIRIS